MDNIAAQEHELLAYATEAVSAIPGIRLIGAAAREKAGVLSRYAMAVGAARSIRHLR
jgi:cysteine desulfurase/selenocysteine lyase